MTQATLLQFTTPTRRPITEWLQHIRSMPPISGAIGVPDIHIGGHVWPGAEEIVAFFYCGSPRDLVCDDPFAAPAEIMGPLYDLARAMTLDSWIIEACDALPGCQGGEIVPRLVAYRWIHGVEISDQYAIHLAPIRSNPWTAVPLRCSSHFPSEVGA